MPPTVSTKDFDAVLFDLDGVLTSTRVVHAGAWERMFDEFLLGWDERHGVHTAPFDQQSDYVSHVDGKPRQEGVRDFLASRGIALPEGSAESTPDEESIWGLGNRKQLLVEDELQRTGVEVFPGSIAWARELREAGLKTAVVSSSRNCAAVLESAGMTNLFDIRVDGQTALASNIPGKPAPDMFLEAARRLGVTPARAVVVEDALAGVEAGRAGAFGLVIGVDRDGHAEQLTEHGADVVVADLGELLTAPEEELHRSGPPEHRLLTAARRIRASSGTYPADPWRLVERAYNPDYIEQTETLFALSNGFLGIRGSFEEADPSYRPGTLLNGFHETWPIRYPEGAYGFATTGQTIAPVPDGTTIRLLVDEDPISCAATEVREFERSLDMKRGVLERRVVYQLGDGRRFRVCSTRFTSLAQRHLACIRYEVTAMDASSRVVICSELTTSELTTSQLTGPVAEADASERLLDPRANGRDSTLGLQPEVGIVDGARVVRSHRAAGSGLTVAAGMDHVLDHHASGVRARIDDGCARVLFELDLPQGEPVTVVKWLAYHHGSADAAQLVNRAALTLDRAGANGYDVGLAEHEREVGRFWSRSDVMWEGASAVQQAMHYNLFTVMQASYRSEGHGIPAKGLTGTGYEGHYFWDSEAYVLPFLTHTAPHLARNLLMHRVRMLPDARRRAREVGCAGALFPWRTINGQEASAYYAAGTAQYHINADIAHALKLYVQVTGDTDLLFRHGVELLVETARMWADLGFFSERQGGKFVIHKVTGPDEYTTVVDNNLFTNLMAAENLASAADAVEQLREASPLDYRRLAGRIDLRDDEPATWRRAADEIYLPYDDKVGVHLQDDGFLDLESWDFAGTPAEHYPLLLHFHPLVIYRHQVIKQADVVLATVLLPERFTDRERRDIFDYYDPLTTGDSSLSESIQSIAAAAVGKFRTAEEYLVDAMAVDVADTAGNLRDGVHVASAGGSWMAVVYGFGGYRWRRTEFSPMLPTRATRVRFALVIRGSVLRVDIQGEVVTYSVSEGDAVTAYHYGQSFTVAPGAPVSFPGVYQTHDAAPSA